MIDPIAYKEKDYLCEKCHWYLMIDSGYGYCRRFPPSILRKYHKGLKVYYENEYPCIPWDTIPCGEFKITTTKQKEPL